MAREGDPELVGIGAFADLTGLSIDALRHYHEVGLLVPAAVDNRTGYRRYRIDQAERARVIASLRALDMPLADIESFLPPSDGVKGLTVLLRHRRHLSEVARAAAARIEQLDALIEGVSNMTSDVGASLRAELLEMFEAQQANGRRLFEQTRSARPERFIFELPEAERPEGWQEGARLAHEFAHRLDEVVRTHGWPVRPLVGDDGAAAAWAIAQHADDDNDLCHAWLPLLREAVECGDAPGVHLAALTDRVLLREGAPQRYGTLVEPVGNSWRLRPDVEDEDDLDARREAIGLPTVDKFLASLPSPDAWYAGETAG